MSKTLFYNTSGFDSLMTEYTPVAQLDRARVYEARCREFESLQECFQWQMPWSKVNQVRKWCKGRKLSVTGQFFY